jgi:hypothetical protein
MATDWTINGDVNLYTNTEVFRIAGNPVLSTPLTGNTLLYTSVPNLTGSYNTILGYQSAQNITSGTENIAIGNAAMQGTVTGSNNLGIGNLTLNSLTSGSNNIGLGQNSLKFQTNGDNCTAVGYNTLQGSSGTFNTALGAGAGSVLAGPGSNCVHIANIGGVGDADLIKIGTQGTQTAAFIAGVYQAPVAVGATLVAADYLGTLGGTPYSGALTSLAPISITAPGALLLSESRNLVYSDFTNGLTSVAAGASNLGTQNTCVGTSAGAALTSGSNTNTFLGYQAGINSGSVTNTIAIGSGSGVGASATSAATGTITIGSTMAFLTTGANNICVGTQAGQFLQSGSFNTLLGYQAAKQLTTGGSNVCIGEAAGGFLSTGSNNVYAGTGAGHGGPNSTNVCIGASAGNTGTGASSNNVFVGSGAGSAYTSGGTNLALGHSAASSPTTGSNNIHILNGGSSSDANTIKIGSQGTQTTAFMAGIYGITATPATAIPVLVSSSGQLGTVSSSIKYKENVRDLCGSDVIHKLRPVEFNYKTQPGVRSVGLIAEEVEKIAPEYIVYQPAEDGVSKGEILTVDYMSLNTLMLMEIQQLKKKVNELEATLLL